MPRNNGKSKRAARKASALLRQEAYNALTAKERHEKQAQFVARRNAMIGADLAAGRAGWFSDERGELQPEEGWISSLDESDD